MSAPTSHAAIVSELISRWPEHRVAPSLSRVQALTDLLGEPQAAVPVIQIAGTNGKGSTAIIIDALLRAQGLRTGRFSSPHLVSVNERIAIDGEPISDAYFDEIYEQIAPFVAIVDGRALDGVKMTFFEVVTAMAFAAFADAPVDVAVVEVGLGGTWDATNVAHAQVAVVTPVDLDHMHLLGDTVAAIAKEKAGIIKAGSLAVLAGQSAAAAGVLLDRCNDVGALAVREGVDFALLERTPAVGGQLLRLNTSGGPVGDLHLPLFGAHMAHNAALAVAAVEAFNGGRALAADVIQDGFDAIVAPARLEVVRRSPTVVLDTAHNPHGAQATMAGAAEAFAFTPLIGVVAMMRDKDIEGVLRVFAGEMTQIVCTAVSSTDRGLPAEDLAEFARDIFGAERVRVARRMDEAIELAVTLADAAGPGAGVLIAGSVIAAGEARALLKREEEADRPEANAEEFY